MSDHNRLITGTAREHLAPCGFFQTGQLDSDSWLLRTERWIAEEVQPATDTREAAHAFVLASVNRRRAALMARPRYRRMSRDAFSCELC